MVLVRRKIEIQRYNGLDISDCKRCRSSDLEMQVKNNAPRKGSQLPWGGKRKHRVRCLDCGFKSEVECFGFSEALRVWDAIPQLSKLEQMSLEQLLCEVERLKKINCQYEKKISEMESIIGTNKTAATSLLDDPVYRSYEISDRIDAGGVLHLTMKDIRDGISFDEAALVDIKYSLVPGQEARKVILHDGLVSRCLKNADGEI